jgi:hypothetical protein
MGSYEGPCNISFLSLLTRAERLSVYEQRSLYAAETRRRIVLHLIFQTIEQPLASITVTLINDILNEVFELGFIS